MPKQISRKAPTALLADSKGGAFVFWAEDRNGDSVPEMFGNRISENGQLLWGENGKSLVVYENNVTRTQAVSDLNDGVFIAYEKKIDLYVHHLHGNGEFLWSTPLKMPIGIWGVLTGDNSGGFFWTAHEQIGCPPLGCPIYRTRMFRYNFAAQSLWTEAGVAIADSGTGSQAPQVFVNGWDDIVVVYLRLHESNTNIFAQRVNFDGELRLEYGGRPIVKDYRAYPARCTAHQSCLASDGNIVAVWQDWRIQTRNLYGQLFYDESILNPDLPVSLRPEVQQSHRIASDGSGGCIVAWYEIGLGSGWGIFSQQISKKGKLGEVLPTSVSEQTSNRKSTFVPILFTLFPNPFSEKTKLEISVIESLPIVISIYDLTGKIVRILESPASAGPQAMLNWDGRNQEGNLLSAGIYVVKVTAGDYVTSRKVVFIH